MSLLIAAGLGLLLFFAPVLRFLGGLLIVCIFYFVLFSGADNPVKTITHKRVMLNVYSDYQPNKILTYEELVEFKPSCDQKQQQLDHLKYIQQVKNFDEDPDKLSDLDRAYNSRLKATIWWYSYSCK